LLIRRILSLDGGSGVLLPVGVFAENLMSVALKSHISLKGRVLFLLEVRLLMLLLWKLVSKLLERRHDDTSIQVIQVLVRSWRQRVRNLFVHRWLLHAHPRLLLLSFDQQLKSGLGLDAWVLHELKKSVVGTFLGWRRYWVERLLEG
jgi:hypothetical protein